MIIVVREKHKPKDLFTDVIFGEVRRAEDPLAQFILDGCLLYLTSFY